MRTVDLAKTPLRELNLDLHRQKDGANEASWEVLNPRGAHAVAVGVDAPINVEVKGSVGYYCGGMNKNATITVQSDDNTGFATPATEGTFTFSAVGGQEIALSGAVDRYVRLNATSLGGATNYTVVGVIALSGITY